MPLKTAAQYREGMKRGQHPAPDDNIDPAEKLECDYMLRMCEYVYSLYVSGYGIVPYDYEDLKELRAYAQGKQNKKKYMGLLDPAVYDGKAGTEEGFLNINWDIVQILPKFLDITMGALMDIEYQATTEAYDRQSSEERKSKYMSMLLETNPEWQQIKNIAGNNLDEEAPDMQGLQTSDDVKMFFEMGGFKLAHEILANDAVQVTDRESYWPYLKDMIIKDLLTIGTGAYKTYEEPKTGIVKHKYIDPEKLIARATMYPDRRDLDFAGSIERMTISQLRLQSELSEAELTHIAKLYADKPENKHYGTANIFNTDQRDRYYQRWNKYPIDDFTIDIMELDFISCDTERFVIGKHKSGNSIFDKVGYDSQLSKRDEKRGKKIMDNKVQFVYHCKWVVGTDYVFDIRKESSVVRKGEPGNKRAVLPYHIYNVDGPAMVERCKAYVDDIQLSTLKIRNIKAKLPPAPSLAVDIGAMQDSVTLGGQKFGITELIEIFGRTGVLIYKSTNEWGMPGASARPPISEISVNAINALNMFRQDIEYNIMQIRNVLGINEVADGSSTQGDMLKGVMQGLQQATNNALRPYVRGYEAIRHQGCEYAAMKWQSVVTAKDVDVSLIPFNEGNVKNVRITKDFSLYDLGISVVLMPTEVDKQMMMQQIIQLRDRNAAEGSGGITAADYFVLSEMVKAGDIKKAQLYLSIAVRKQKEESLKERQMLMQQQQQVQIQTAQASDQSKAQVLQMEHQLKMQEMQMEHQLKMQEMEKKKNDQIELIIAKTQADTGRDMVNKDNTPDEGLVMNEGRQQSGMGQSNLERNDMLR
jgi:hypothetical protein